MQIKLPNTIPFIALATFLAEHGLVLAPDGSGHYSAIPSAVHRAAAAKAERLVSGIAEFVS